MAIAQTGHAIAPAFFGLNRELTVVPVVPANGAAPVVFLTAAVIQGLAVVAFVAGRRA